VQDAMIRGRYELREEDEQFKEFAARWLEEHRL
jgi:hypothetical protein